MIRNLLALFFICTTAYGASFEGRNLKLTGFATGSIVTVGAGPYATQDNANLFWDDYNNWFGVGTSSPLYRMHVKMAGATSTDSITWEGSGASASRKWNWMPDSSGFLYMKNLNEAYYSMVFDNVGRVGIGKSSPAAQFHVQPRQANFTNSIFQGYASQSANLTEWRNDSATVLSKVAANGGFTMASANVTNLTESQPVVTDSLKNLASVSYPTFLTNLGALPLSGGTLTGDLTIKGLHETVVAGTTCSTSYNVNPTNGTGVNLYLNGACTIGSTNVATGDSFTIYLTQLGTTAPTFGSEYKWVNGTVPTFSTTATKDDTVVCSAKTSTKLICGALIDNR